MSSLSRFLNHNAHTFLSLVPAVRDGSVDAIHDARVATRRLRAALDIIIGAHRAEEELEAASQLARRAARALGRARDIDVSLALLAEIERRALLEAECVGLYDRFIERRAEILAFCERLAAQPAPARVLTGTLLTLGAVAAGSAWRVRQLRAVGG